MENEPKKVKISFSTLILVIILILFIIIGLVIYKMQNEDKNIVTNNITKESSNVVNASKTNSTVEDIRKPTLEEETIGFLTSGSAISTTDTVGAYIPEHYIFEKDGNFTYTATPYYKNEEDIIRYSGTWEVKDNTLILNIKEETKVQGGTIKKAEASEPYDHLVGYSEVTTSENYKIEYKILEFVIEENHVEYVKLEGINLYKIGI